VSESVTKWIFCNNCKSETRHTLRATYSRRRIVHEDGERFEPGDITTSIWSCAGCDDETFEWQYKPTDNEIFDPVYLPTRSVDSLQRKRFKNLGSDLTRVYGEVITSFNEGCLVLCTIGLRALIERICRDKGLREGNLEQRIDCLVKFLPSVNCIEALHAFRVVGNTAAHELEALTRDNARAAIAVIEDLLNFFYDFDYRASQMQDTLRKESPGSTKLRSIH